MAVDYCESQIGRHAAAPHSYYYRRCVGNQRDYEKEDQHCDDDCARFHAELSLNEAEIGVTV